MCIIVHAKQQSPAPSDRAEIPPRGPTFTKGKPSARQHKQNVYDESTSESMSKIYLGHVSFFLKTTTNLTRSM